MLRSANPILRKAGISSSFVMILYGTRRKIQTPKAWRTERERLEKEMPTLRNERARACHDLAFAEVISYNKANLERVGQNEERQQAVSRTKRREEEI